jgi:hypothetical protein
MKPVHQRLASAMRLIIQCRLDLGTRVDHTLWQCEQQ